MVKRVVKGKAFNIAPGMVLFKGKNPNKTDDIDVGPNNPKEGISVDNNEIGRGFVASADGKSVTPIGNTIQIFSNQPMLEGVSPTQLLYGGMAPDKVFAIQEAFKNVHGINDDGSKAQFGLFKKIKEKLSGKSNNDNNQTPVKESEYVSYFDATDEQKSHLINKKGKYNIESVGDYGDTHFSVVEARYKSLTDTMRKKGFTDEEIDRLSPFLITQQVLEGGYKISNDTNNFGGILVPGTNKKMSFKSVDDFNEYYLNNLDEKWGDDYLGKGKGWRNAKTLKEYADTINREDLRLYTKEAHSEYNRQHKDKPAYIYTPLWENNNTGLMSEPKFGGIYPRVYGMIDLLKTRIEDWNNMAKTNNIVKKQFGGDIDLNSLVNRINTTSNADFVKRLKDPNRKHIRKGNTIYTHLLSYVTDGDKAIVYPEVQSADKGLKIFKGREALDRAIEQRDTLHMSVPEAEAFTTQYKDYYPGFKFGGQTNINSLGERPNAKYGKQMKNKRNKALAGRQQFSINGLPAFDFTIPNSFGNYSLDKPFYPTYVDGPLIGLRVPQKTLNIPAFPNNFSPKVTVGKVDPFMGTKPAFGTSTTGTQKTNPVDNLTKGSGLSTTAMSAIGAGINTLGSLIGSGIQQAAINGIKAPQRQYTLLNPVKLKTKININPQIARMREMQAQLADAARRTSGSSRTAYQKLLAGHNRLLDSTMDLYARKENAETELINRDRLNQQQVDNANATNVMNAVNQNNELAVNNDNYKRVATSNNWISDLNTTAGPWAGPNGFIDRANALRVKAGELYTQAIANPTAARLLYGDIDFTTGANKRKAFNTIYDFLNNNRFA